MRVTFDQAIGLTTDLLRRAGVPSANALHQARLLVVAEAKGVPSHGLLRLPRLLRRMDNGTADPQATGSHRWRSPTFLEVDGEQGLGPVVAHHALEMIMPIALGEGLAAAAITHSNHLGMLSFYTEWVAAQGLVALALTTSEALVHPWGGSEAMVGTNPVSIAVPADPDPLVLDMATSAVSMGKIHDFARRGRPLEPGWALDQQGRPTTDAAAATAGSIAPFGGPKGYALGLGLGALVAAVTGSSTGTDVHGTLDDDRPSSKGDLFLLLRADHDVSDYLRALRASRPADRAGSVAVPGDNALRRLRRSLADGFDVDDVLWRELTELGADATLVGG